MNRRNFLTAAAVAPMLTPLPELSSGHVLPPRHDADITEGVVMLYCKMSITGRELHGTELTELDRLIDERSQDLAEELKNYARKVATPGSAQAIDAARASGLGTK